MLNPLHHEPEEYSCPFCVFLAGHGDNYTQQQDVVYKNEFSTVVIAPRWWIHNPGSVLVVPNKHFENIYDIPEEYFVETYKTAKKVALAIRKTYECDGVSTRQHNEPAGGQDVWHFHVQVLPRYRGDNLYKNNDNNRFADAAERLPFAEKLRAYFAERS